jgi:hypothetical protein
MKKDTTHSANLAISCCHTLAALNIIFYNTITCLITKTLICHVHQNKWFAQFFCRTEPFVLTTGHEITLVHLQLQLIKTNN